MGSPVPEGATSEDHWSDAMLQSPEQPGFCPLLRQHTGAPEGDFSCTGHTGMVPAGEEDPYYMQACIMWPSDPDQIADYPSCTYTFQWVD